MLQRASAGQIDERIDKINLVFMLIRIKMYMKQLLYDFYVFYLFQMRPRISLSESIYLSVRSLVTFV